MFKTFVSLLSGHVAYLVVVPICLVNLWTLRHVLMSPKQPVYPFKCGQIYLSLLFFSPGDKCNVIVRFVKSRLLFRYASGI